MARLSRKTVALGYREWRAIIWALVHGTQSLLLRKGGIAEKGGAFSFQAANSRHFFLLPSHYHDQGNYVLPEFWQKYKCEFVRKNDEIDLRVEFFCTTEYALFIDDWERLSELRDLHVWSDEHLQRRFYDEKFGEKKSCGISCALVRVYRLREPWFVGKDSEYGGCKSWFELPEEPVALRDGAMPVLEDKKFADLRTEFLDVLGL